MCVWSCQVRIGAQLLSPRRVALPAGGGISMIPEPPEIPGYQLISCAGIVVKRTDLRIRRVCLPIRIIASYLMVPTLWSTALV